MADAMSNLELRRILPALTTPFDFDGGLDLPGLKHNLAAYCEAGFTSFVALGTTGEGVCLSGDEKRAVLRTIREVVGSDAGLVAGVCEQSTHRATRDILTAAVAGADAALVLTPHFYAEQLTQTALIRFYHEVADASPIPIVVDHEPAVTSAVFETASIKTLTEHPRIVGFRDASGNQSTLSQLVRSVPTDFAILVGRAGVLLAGLEAGASGAILAEAGLAPKQCLEIYDFQHAGMKVRATALQARFGPLSQALATRWGLPGLKASLGLVGFAGGPPRSPMSSIPRSDRRRLVGVLLATGFFPSLTRTG